MQNNLQVVIPQVNQSETGRNVLYVSDLPTNVTESDLEAFFADFKDSIVFLQISGGSKSYEQFNKKVAKVIFKDTKAADAARREKNMCKIKGRAIRVMWEERDNSSRYSSQANLFIKNIPSEVKPREFYEFFLGFGDISSSKVPENENGHLGYGYINYYSPESATKAIQATNEKEIWGSKLEANYFQKKNERANSYGLATSNNSIYIKNFPANFSEGDLRTLCSQNGEVTSLKICSDDLNRKFAIVSFSNDEAASKAVSALNGFHCQDGSVLFVDSLMNKQERKKILSTKILDSNYRLNEQYKLCNLHIRNIPYHAKEEDLTEAFKKFGEVKSVKIEKYMLVTKVNNELKEIPTSKGFGYVCFENAEAAQKACEEMNEKYLPKFETWKRPLIIEFFMPKVERTPVVVGKINQTSGNKFGMYGMGGMGGMGVNPLMSGFMPGYGGMQGIGYPNFPGMPINPPFNNQMNKPQRQLNQPSLKPRQEKETAQDDLDYNYLNSLDYDSKKDYLGEYIFKKIENHKLALSHSLTIDLIGKVTGMILGIEDIKEIIEIYKNSDNLTARISEALELIKKN